jgi:PAS domain S-box-containing protein
MFFKTDTASPSRDNDLLENKLLTAWLESSDMGLCVLDSAGRVVMLNQATCQLLDIEGVAALNTSWADLLAKIDQKSGPVALTTSANLDDESHFTRTGLTGTQHLLFKYRNVQAASGENFKLLSITDVTSLLAAQLQADQHRQWQAINAGVVVSDARLPDMPIVYVNAMFEEMSGYTSAEIVGRNCRFLQGQDKDQPALADIKLAIRNQTNGYATLRNYRKDGTPFMNEPFISPIRDQAGEVTHFLGIQHLRGHELPPVADAVRAL